MLVCETSGIETTLLMNHSPETVSSGRSQRWGHRDRHSRKASCKSFIILLYYQTNIIFVLHLIDECGVCILKNVRVCVWDLTARTYAYSHIYTRDSLLIVEHLMRKENICSIICSSHMPNPITYCKTQTH